MIKANELRIGNKIYIELGLPSLDIHTIKGQDIADISNGRITLNSLQPIPLTPEILEKAGFDCYLLNLFGDTYLQLDPDGDVFNIFLQFQNDRDCTDKLLMKAEIKYVHQLQNLFFALTGEELTLTL